MPCRAERDRAGDQGPARRPTSCVPIGCCQARLETPALLGRAAAARRELVKQRVGGSWWHCGELPAGEGTVVVVAGGSGRSPASTSRDAGGGAGGEPAGKIVLLAPAQRPRAIYSDGGRAWLRCRHPAGRSVAGDRARRAGLFGRRRDRFPRPACRVRGSLLRQWVLFGMGVDGDDATVPQKPFRRTVDEIFAGACCWRPAASIPIRNAAAAFEDMVLILADWRRIEAANREVAVLVGMSFWKRRRVTDFFRSAAGAPAFRRTARARSRRQVPGRGVPSRCGPRALPTGSPKLQRAGYPADPGRGRLCPLGRPRLRFHAGGIPGARPPRHALRPPHRVAISSACCAKPNSAPR